MKTLLIAGGILFLLLGVVLILAAIIAAALGRKKAAAMPQPHSGTFSPTPAPTPILNTPPPSNDATVVVSLRPEGAGALHGISGSVLGQIFSIPADGFFIGREAAFSQVVIADHRVSKRHVWIGMKNGVMVAVDQTSTNGTFLNQPSLRVSETTLNPGDVLIISDDVARLEYRR